MGLVVELRKAVFAKLECSKCGAPGEATCECHAPYVPAGTRAEAAVVENPEMSNRAIAGIADTSEATVRRARKKLTASHDAVAPRIGRDGKQRRQPKRKAIKAINLSQAHPHMVAAVATDEGCVDCDNEEQRWQMTVGNFAGAAIAMEAYLDRMYPDWSKYPVESVTVELAKQAVEAWKKLASKLSRRSKRNAKSKD
jgi:hypothetical protein